MKKCLVVIALCMASLLQADAHYEIALVQKLLKEAPDKKTFLQLIAQKPQEGKSVLAHAQEKSPRLEAALERYRTSLTFTDQGLQDKLSELLLEQELLSALKAKDLNGTLNAVKNGADINTALEGGQTPLILAVVHSDQSAVKELLSRGAKKHLKADFVLNDANGKSHHEHMSALEFAQHMGYKLIAKILQKASSL
ncbi:MAG: ankyrin repeat protein [Alteromonas naphthalenivorans]|jgi:ankyrin repeat protein